MTVMQPALPGRLIGSVDRAQTYLNACNRHPYNKHEYRLELGRDLLGQWYVRVNRRRLGVSSYDDALQAFKAFHKPRLKRQYVMISPSASGSPFQLADDTAHDNHWKHFNVG